MPLDSPARCLRKGNAHVVMQRFNEKDPLRNALSRDVDLQLLLRCLDTHCIVVDPMFMLICR